MGSANAKPGRAGGEHHGERAAMTRKIYLAGSWKNAEKILALQRLLQADGHEVDCFASTNAAALLSHG